MYEYFNKDFNVWYLCLLKKSRQFYSELLRLKINVFFAKTQEGIEKNGCKDAS